MQQVRPTSDNARTSLIDGGPLREPGVQSLAQVLPRAADLTRHQALCFLGEDGAPTWISYAELLDDASRVLAGLRRAGAGAGDRVILRIAREQDLLAAFWACVLGGMVAVPVSARLTDSDVTDVWRTLDRPWTLTHRPGARVPAQLGTVAELRQYSSDRDWAASGRDEVAVLVLTAGSTGTPKAVELSHNNILSRSASTAAVNGLTSSTTTFNWMPMDHVSGLVMFHIRDAFLACRQIHARKEWVLADPLRWLDVVDAYGVDTTWATNPSFDLISEQVEAHPDRNWDLSRLRYIMNGGAPVKARTIGRFLANTARFGLSPTAMRPGWGMSETASGVVDHRLAPGSLSDDDRFVPVGRPHPGVSVRVVDEQDRVVSEGTVGHLQVAGAPVTAGYYGSDPDRNQRLFTADGWLRTSDLAFVEDGTLTVTGSADDAIFVDGRVYHGHEIEAAVEELPYVEKSYTVACPVGDRAAGHEELAVFCALRDPGEADEATDRIRETIRSRYGLEVAHVVPLAKDDIPKTGTGKPKRAELRASFPRFAAAAH